MPLEFTIRVEPDEHGVFDGREMARQLTTHLSCWCMFGDQNSSHSAGDAVQISSRRHDKVTIFDLSGDIDCANSRQLRESVLREIQENRRPTSW